MPASALIWAAVGVWGGLGVYVSVTDIREGIIPGRWVWRAGFAVAALLGTAVVLEGEPLRLAWAFATAAGAGLAFEVVYRINPEGVGYGDVRLIILNSLLIGYWGPQWAVWALCAGAVAALPQSVTALLRDRNKNQPSTQPSPAATPTETPGRGHVRWGPYLVAGAAAVLAWRIAADGLSA